MNEAKALICYSFDEINGKQTTVVSKFYTFNNKKERDYFANKLKKDNSLLDSFLENKLYKHGKYLEHERGEFSNGLNKEYWIRALYEVKNG